jgi:hypothetical protein
LGITSLIRLPAQAGAGDFARWKRCRVAPDYHVEIDSHWYFTPYRLIRELVDGRITDKTVEIFHKGQRIESHARAPNRRGYTTIADHMILSRMRVPAQPVHATQALNLSAGISNCKVSRGRSLADEPVCSDTLASAPISRCPSINSVFQNCVGPSVVGMEKRNAPVLVGELRINLKARTDRMRKTR